MQVTGLVRPRLRVGEAVHLVEQGVEPDALGGVKAVIEEASLGVEGTEYVGAPKQPHEDHVQLNQVTPHRGEAVEAGSIVNQAREGACDLDGARGVKTGGEG